jgi:hypothetical protein
MKRFSTNPVKKHWWMVRAGGRLNVWIGSLLFGGGSVIQAAPAEVYVDVAYRTNGAWVTFPNSGGTGTYCVGSNAFNSIEAGVDNVAAGGTVHVAAGTYVENVPMAKPLTMLGPNAGRPGAGPRLPEAILVPAYNDPENSPIIVLESSHIIIDGFLLDGNNPSPPPGFGAGYNANGVQVYAAAGVQNGYYPDLLDVDHITIQNNIIRNISYDGVYLDRYRYFETASGWNFIRDNKFENLWEGLLTYAVDAVIANNTITNVTHGLSVHGVCVASPEGFTPQISSNSLSIAEWWPAEIEVVHAPGIWVNFRRGTASTLNVRANVISTPKPAPAGKIIRAIEVLTVDEKGKVNLIGNVVNGYGNCHEGIYAAACWSNDAVTVRGGALNEIKNYGIFLRTTDPEWPPEWPRAVDTFLTISGTTIRMASGGSGIFVWQDPTTPTNCAKALITGNSSIHGASVGVRLLGAKAAATIKNNSDLFGATRTGIEVDGGKALVESNNLTACTVAAISVRNNAVIDAGDCAGRNLTGLGTGGNAGGSSLGLNDFSGYGFDGQQPWAVTNSGSAKVVAHRNSFGALPGESIAQAFSNEVEFSQFGDLQLEPPPPMTVASLLDVPAPLIALTDFLAAGGKASCSPGTLQADDTVQPKESEGYIVARNYTLTDACGESGACQQIINVIETACTLSVSRTPEGGTALVVRGKPGERYALQATTNFRDWASLRTNTAPFTWVDTAPGTFSCRFYRAVIVP